MGLFSRNLGFWAGCAALVGALFTVAPDAAAGPSGKTAHHGHATGKRAALPDKKVERARAGKNLPAAWKTPAKAAENKPAALDSKSAKDDKPSADSKSGKDTKAADSKSAKVADSKSGKDASKPIARDPKLGAKDAKSAKALGKKEPVVPASSVGSPNEGKLVGGVKLDTSDGTVRVVPAYQRGDTRWGLPALIHMLERSSKKVAKKNPGAVLGVGDISRKNGGDIFLHRSHESGRDADIAFYVVDHRGKNLLPETFVQFQGSIESSSMPGARFDVAKNWQLVQAWLEDPQARVSHIFVADPLRRVLLAHARPRVSPALYNRAAAVMMQPSNALPHDNHFHVRISCPAEMRKSCVEYPAGVFAKKAKAKPGVITPHKKPGEKALAGGARSTDKALASAAKPGDKHAANHAAKPTDKAHAAKPSSPRVAAAKPAKPAKSGAAPDQSLAASEPKKKPIYLQSAVANAGDTLDTLLFSVPALSHLNDADPDGDADGEDVKASVDETGTVKITD